MLELFVESADFRWQCLHMAFPQVVLYCWIPPPTSSSCPALLVLF